MKFAYTEDQLDKVFDEPVNGVKRFFEANRSSKDEDGYPSTEKLEKKEKESNPIDTMAEPTDEPEEKESKEKKEDKDTTQMSSKVRSLYDNLKNPKDEYDFISLTDLDVAKGFKTSDYTSLLNLIANKKIKVSTFGKSGKSDPNPGNVPNDEIIFYI